MSPIYRNRFRVHPQDVDQNGQLRISALLRYSQEIAGQHCDLLGVNQQFLDEKGLFWAIIRNRITVSRLPKAGQTVILETWPMPTTRTAYPRATAAYDEAGNHLFSCHSLWILMDMETRAMVLPGKSGVEVTGLLRENTPPPPKSLSPISEGFCCRQQVSEADLDKNNHMNNARYLDWVDSILPPEISSLRSANLCYLNEARLGQILDICWQTEAPGQLSVEIRRAKEDGGFDRIFAAKLEFDSVVL